MPSEDIPNTFTCAEAPLTTRNMRQPIRKCPELVPVPERAATNVDCTLVTALCDAETACLDCWKQMTYQYFQGHDYSKEVHYDKSVSATAASVNSAKWRHHFFPFGICGFVPRVQYYIHNSYKLMLGTLAVGNIAEVKLLERTLAAIMSLQSHKNGLNSRAATSALMSRTEKRHMHIHLRKVIANERSKMWASSKNAIDPTKCIAHEAVRFTSFAQGGPMVRAPSCHADCGMQCPFLLGSEGGTRCPVGAVSLSDDARRQVLMRCHLRFRSRISSWERRGALAGLRRIGDSGGGAAPVVPFGFRTKPASRRCGSIEWSIGMVAANGSLTCAQRTNAAMKSEHYSC
eukprot:4130123-Pleurochrysis_carterae.AAC.4